METIDAHCHFWRLSRGDYGWLDGTGGPLHPIRRDFGLDDYPSDARRIVVQAAPSAAETDFLLSLAAEDPRIVGVVGWVDLTAPDAADQIRSRAAAPVFKGVRPMLQDIDDTDWLESCVPADAIAALTDAGLRLDALVTTRHLPMLGRFAERHNDLPLIIDHAAKPQPGTREDWADGMRRLATLPHVHCKLSGLLTELAPQELRQPLPALQAIFRPLLDWFGPDRIVWGSDWPVLTLAASYDEWRDLTDELLLPLTDAERRAVLSANAARFYGITP